MDIPILDYKPEVKRLISENYEPADVLSKEFKKTTFELLVGFSSILPPNSIDENLLYEVLTEMGFEPKEEDPLVFFWYFRRK